MNILAIIPARGGSKGIPRKNLRLLAGKPLLAYSVENALGSPSITRVVVSTDDRKIASVAKQYGAEVIWRPAEISGDTASSESALLHALEHLHRSEGYRPDLVVFLQCTSPLTLPEDIEGTIQALLEQHADSALAVTPFHYFLWRTDREGDAVGINHDKWNRPLRQEREPQYLETGAIYVMRTKAFLEAKHRFFGKTALYVMPRSRCLEIDEPPDLGVAETLLQLRARQNARKVLPNPIQALVLDFDGVFTDNRVIVQQDGKESVVVHRGDGWGIARLKESGLPILVLSGETNPVVETRCNKLGLSCYRGVKEKIAVLRHWLKTHHFDPAKTIYLGNDVNDRECLEYVGCGVVVADAHPGVIPVARLVLQHPGGRGAIRELADLILGECNYG